jgi:hypothetical protein
MIKAFEYTTAGVTAAGNCNSLEAVMLIVIPLPVHNNPDLIGCVHNRNFVDIVVIDMNDQKEQQASIVVSLESGVMMLPSSSSSLFVKDDDNHMKTLLSKHFLLVVVIRCLSTCHIATP